MKRFLTLTFLVFLLANLLVACGSDGNTTSLGLVTPVVTKAVTATPAVPTILPTVTISSNDTLIRPQFEMFKKNECQVHQQVDSSKLSSEVRDSMLVKVSVDIRASAGSITADKKPFPREVGFAGLIKYNSKIYLVTTDLFFKTLIQDLNTLKAIFEKSGVKAVKFEDLEVLVIFQVGQSQPLSIKLNTSTVTDGWLTLPSSSNNLGERILMREVSAGYFTNLGIETPSTTDSQILIDGKRICDGRINLFGVSVDGGIVSLGYNGTIGDNLFYTNEFGYGSDSPVFRTLSGNTLRNGSLIVMVGPQSVQVIAVVASVIPENKVKASGGNLYTFLNQPIPGIRIS